MTDIIIDTDIGDDIDDALALTMALNSPELRILGVTTVYGDVQLRAQLAARLLDAAQRRDIPVAAGEGRPLNQEIRPDLNYAQARVLDGCQPYEISSLGAVEQMRTLLDAADAGITIVCIGPLTNLATLLYRYPHVKGRIQEVVLMGGTLTMPMAEYNIRMDPEAADIVFRSQLALKVVPFDITRICEMERDVIDRMTSDKRPLQALSGALIIHWQQANHNVAPILHDPLAIGCLLSPHLYQFKPYSVSIELADKESRGYTTGQCDPIGSVQICCGVNYGGFHELYNTLILN